MSQPLIFVSMNVQAIVATALRTGSDASAAFDRAEMWIDAIAESRGSKRAAYAIHELRRDLLCERAFLAL